MQLMILLYLVIRRRCIIRNMHHVEVKILCVVLEGVNIQHAIMQ